MNSKKSAVLRTIEVLGSRIGKLPHQVENTVALRLVENLCHALQTERINYCHWKSNANLHQSAVGENDLDLLVCRSDVQRFTALLQRLGFKMAQGSPKEQMPGVLDYYGYDKEADKWVHVHAHYMLVVGHDATKNYHLPVETAYLQSSVQTELFRVPSPEFEWIMFVIRMVIKHSTWDTILGRQGALSPSERREMKYLQDRITPEKIDAILEQRFPSLDRSLFDSLVLAISPDCPLLIRFAVGARLRRRLKVHGRRSQGLDLWIKFRHRLVTGVRRRLMGRIPKKHLVSGGLIVGIIGGDGSGKTTAVNELHQWLSKEFETMTVHLGKPQWSWTTLTIRGILKIGRSLGLYPFMQTEITYPRNLESPAFPGYPWLLREVCTARDRYLTYRRARRFSANGGIVICDRFPLKQIQLMDGPQIWQMMTVKHRNWATQRLEKMEKRYYRAIASPEVLIVLKADPETAVKRKVDEDPNSVRARCTEIWELNWEDAEAHVVDANRPSQEVLQELKGFLWAYL